MKELGEGAGGTVAGQGGRQQYCSKCRWVGGEKKGHKYRREEEWD